MADKFTIKEVFRNGEKIAVTESVCIPGCLDTHRHDYIEIAYIYAGTGYHILNGGKNLVRKGDVFMLSVNSMHNYEAVTPDFKWYNVLVQPEIFDMNLIDINTAYDFLRVSVFSEFKSFNIGSDIELYRSERRFDNIFVQMMEEYRNKDTCYQEILKSLLTILIINMFREFIKVQSGQKPHKTEADIVIEHLQENLDEKINIIEIAQKAFVSPDYFARLFKKKTGKTLTLFIQECKIKKACDLLDNTDRSVLDIMRDIGYSDAKYFYQIFKKVINLTPAQYRKNKHGK